MTTGHTAHRVALVGCGAFGTFVLDAIHDLPGVRVAACADADRQRARTLAGRYGATVHTSVEDVAALDDVDVVVLATPPAAHADAAVAALRAGKHVFCEKPMALTVEDAARVAAESRRSRGVFVVDHVLRYNPVLRLLKRLGQEQLLDPLRRFAFENDASDEDLGDDHWFWDEAHSGGVHVEHGVHFFDAANALMGSEPLQVQGTEVRREDGPVDIVVATAVHPGGTVATHTHSFTHAHRAERQLMRLDYGFAEARVSGWIPTSATITAWTDEAGAVRWEAVPARAAELLSVPGLRPHGQERIAVSVTRDAGSAAPARGRGVTRHVPHRVDCVVDLGGEERKQHVYTESVRAAMSDLLHCAVHGGTPQADATAGLTAVAVARAATRSAHSGRTVLLTAQVPAGDT
ncbi:putative dehydrogenase [Streptomyces sp. SAI-135]|uniref:Gfo/Idh/MocA family protein n=1 Tax=unclassified Streptomyces TaxID=2593676 RepID=UPI0024766497|nr:MULTISPECIES: Gfo/Idh/MocA family oxidoreductase [unclassified Streptomyces]MDH6521772.1 putative dehydrogenase [Streptomyces sp. SAI-090]MDH6614128.1 putative dehydrogenase [Streptomyces sp. SAI-135]